MVLRFQCERCHRVVDGKPIHVDYNPVDLCSDCAFKEKYAYIERDLLEKKKDYKKAKELYEQAIKVKLELLATNYNLQEKLL